MSPRSAKTGTSASVSMLGRLPPDKLGPRAERTIETILDAAREVFLRLGYNGATIDEIAKEAMISRASVYTYFTSKREIFFALGAAASDQREIGALVDSLVAPIDLDQCLILVEGWFAHHHKNAGFSTVWREAAADDDEMREIGGRAYRRICRHVGRSLAKHSVSKIPDPIAFGVTVLAQWEGAWRYCFLYRDFDALDSVKLMLARELLAILTSAGPT